MRNTTEKLLIVLYMKDSRYLKLMSEGNTMNDAIAMMFSILIVMFGYLVFKIRTDQSQTTTTSTRKRSKKKGTGKPVIKNNWNMRPLDTKDPADKDLRYEDFVESSPNILGIVQSVFSVFHRFKSYSKEDNCV